MALYPEIEAFTEERLKVSDIHELHIEQAGNPNGIPVVFLHGGPGGGISSNCRRFFDPEFYRVILFDQRGAGKSTPHAELTDNSTWDLVADIEKIREHYGIDRWHVFGGSWGSTLSLSYAINHPERVLSLVLRGIFLCRPHEIQWFYQQGASRIFPDAWEAYYKHIPEGERKDIVAAYYKRLTSDDQTTRTAAAKAWSVWEASTSKLVPDKNLMNDFGQDKFALAFARIECHFFTHNAFFETNNYLLENCDKIKDIPCSIVHGRYDVICPLENAWELHQALPKSELFIMENSGHSAFETEIADKLVEIMDSKKQL